MEVQIRIKGMSCHNCVKHVSVAILGVSGVSHVNVDLESGIASLEYTGTDLTPIYEAIEEEGYEVER